MVVIFVPNFFLTWFNYKVSWEWGWYFASSYHTLTVVLHINTGQTSVAMNKWNRVSNVSGCLMANWGSHVYDPKQAASALGWSLKKVIAREGRAGRKQVEVELAIAIVTWGVLRVSGRITGWLWVLGLEWSLGFHPGMMEGEEWHQCLTDLRGRTALKTHKGCFHLLEYTFDWLRTRTWGRRHKAQTPECSILL